LEQFHDLLRQVQLIFGKEGIYPLAEVASMSLEVAIACSMNKS
jgi:hypothetical protein